MRRPGRRGPGLERRAPRGAGVIVSLLAAALAVSAIQDTTSALPGTPLRFGMETSRLGAAQGFQPAPGGQAPDRQQRVGAMRFFGIDATATLSFLDRRLVEAEFVIENASPRQIAYIDDDLRRRGYRRGCAILERERSRCTWTGATRVELAREGARITATIRPLTREERRAPAADAPAIAAAGARDSVAGMPMHPDTLSLPPGWTEEDFLIERAPAPEYPAAAREAGVQGVVRLLARVDTSGAVTEVRIVRGIPELDSAAVATARGMRFRPFVHEGRRVGGWVRLPIRYTIH